MTAQNAHRKDVGRIENFLWYIRTKETHYFAVRMLMLPDLGIIMSVLIAISQFLDHHLIPRFSAFAIL